MRPFIGGHSDGFHGPEEFQRAKAAEPAQLHRRGIEEHVVQPRSGGRPSSRRSCREVGLQGGGDVISGSQVLPPPATIGRNNKGKCDMKIGVILDQIDLGSIALPEFQRGYVWNRDQVRGLMQSLYLGTRWAACWSG